MTTSLRAAALAVLVAVGAAVVGGQALRPDTPAAVVSGQLAALQVAPAADVTYDGDSWGDWLDLDRDCQNTRAEVLIEQFDDEVLTATGCTVVSGLFDDPYTGVSGEALASRVQIDHVVAQADADRSGGNGWSEQRKAAFTNDEGNLLATNSTANRCKSDKGPAEWDEPPVLDDTVCGRQRAPQDPDLRHAYACRYTATKARWGLTVTADDQATLAAMLIPGRPC